ncbi:amidohydrolase family protein [Clostridium magnum]|uniref:Amidohydrolase n=1 Tax=Clostridium magnum DSM 2767 TaxID=1121326 RepID=A0A161X4X4_9CLOT|nr:amidohydrolase family protein [Clostridium magnum]KZL88986.1 amidohydrolase [Clostridium magnum DSM 2767]SHI23466.1 Amidohydrolase [Clostridium magnum DSM 2767]
MIDIHTHLWDFEAMPEAIRTYFVGKGNEQVDPKKYTAEGLLESMSQAGIEYSIVSALAYSHDLSWDNIHEINEYVRKAVAASDGKLIGFCTVDPFGGEASITMLRKCMEEEGFKGLKLHGNMQRFYPNDKRLYEIYKVMQSYHKPILFHTGGIGLKAYRDCYGQISNFDDVACDFPELPIILGHAGRLKYEELAVLLRKHTNIYADISTNFSKASEYRTKPMEKLFQTVLEWCGTSSHLLFGSDYPFYAQKQTVDNMNLMEHRTEILKDLEDNTQVFVKKFGII